jgi:hypothetical protein
MPLSPKGVELLAVEGIPCGAGGRHNLVLQGEQREERRLVLAKILYMGREADTGICPDPQVVILTSDMNARSVEPSKQGGCTHSSTSS